jgi:phosphotransacetylase
MLRSFEDVCQLARTGGRRRCAVPGAGDAHALEAVFEAAADGYVEPVLIGPASQIRAVLDQTGLAGRPHRLVDAPNGRNPAEVAVELVRAGEADFIAKGLMETRDLLKPIVNKSAGLNDEGFITHFGLMRIAGHHKLLAMSDAAVIPYPDLAAKRKIVSLGVAALGRLGNSAPVVAALCAVETVNPAMPETVEAAELAQLGRAGAFGAARVIGPVSYDLATSAESARIKGYDQPGAGQADMLLVPQMVTGNVMSKIWNADPRNTLAGCLVGARVPVALTSRSASAAEKLHSLILCAALSDSGSQGTLGEDSR